MVSANALFSLLLALKWRFRYVVKREDGRWTVVGDTAFWRNFALCFLGLCVVSAFAFTR
jgi:hypothetical protein